MMADFVFPYGADRNIRYMEFIDKEKLLLNEYQINVSKKRHLESIYSLRYQESMTKLYKEYEDVLKPMSVDEYMKEFNIQIGNYYDCGGIALKLIGSQNNYLVFDDGTRHNVTMSFNWKECEAPNRNDEKPQKKITYDMYSDWSKSLAKDYSVEELQNKLLKEESLTEKYTYAHLRAIESSTSMQSNSQRRAHARNNVTGNYYKKMALSHALEIHKMFPLKAKQTTT